MSSYNSLDLFGSGPHRTLIGRRANLITLDFFEGQAGGGSTPQGLQDWDIVIRGRLIATTEANLNALRAAILLQLQQPPVVATLVDTRGNSWTSMSLVSFGERGRRDRGRLYSVRYDAVFRRF
jgi:hypothetical protein